MYFNIVDKLRQNLGDKRPSGDYFEAGRRAGSNDAAEIAVRRCGKINPIPEEDHGEMDNQRQP